MPVLALTESASTATGDIRTIVTVCASRPDPTPCHSHPSFPALLPVSGPAVS